MSSATINRQSLEGVFARELAKLTKRATEALYRQLEKTDQLEKRRVFDVGLHDWAESLANCAAEFLPRFRAFFRQNNSTSFRELAEAGICGKLTKFLGVDVATEPGLWPESNRIETFTRSACFCGASLPSWFDVGFFQAARIISRRPPSSLGEETSRQRLCEVYGKFAETLLDALGDHFIIVSMDFGMFAEQQTEMAKRRKKVTIPKMKEKDLSDILRPEVLTTKQREVMSLRWEKGMTVTAIAAHYGVDRSTIQGHIRAATRKLNNARQNDAARRGAVGRTRPQEADEDS
jgi:DNA-binding CsgD family transcriptional regulator